jgi:hypothetical protein
VSEVAMAADTTNRGTKLVQHERAVSPWIAREQGLVAWWRAEDNTRDEVGNADGRLMGSMGFAPGKTGQAFSLDGINGYVVIPSCDDLNIIGGLSITAWINPTRVDRGEILTKYDTSVSCGASYWIVLDQGRLNFGVKAMNGECRRLLSKTATLPVGSWSHIAGTFDPADQALKLYLNGEQIAGYFDPAPGNVWSIATNTTSLRIGASVGQSGALEAFFSGLIDEVKLYNRALSPSEILADYAQRFRLLMPPRGETTSPNLIDLSAYYNDWLDDHWDTPAPAGSSVLPLGVVSFDRTSFDVRGMIVLSGLGAQREGHQLPERVKAIPVKQRCRRLHFLHAAAWIVADGAAIGSYVMHFRDGPEAERPIIYGKDVCHYGRRAAVEKPSPGPPFVWEGRIMRIPEYQCRLYHAVWENPRPEVEIDTLDFVSSMTESSPLLIAITAE